MADLTAALKRPDSDTVQMPSGRLATVGQIRFIQPIVEKRLGYKLTTLLQQPSPTAPATRVDASTTVAQWKEILQKPDSTVVESPQGKRITVGELKQAVKNQMRDRQAVRQKRPVLAPANPGDGRPR
jgi:hypothetical protein